LNYKDEWLQLEHVEEAYDNISKGSLSTSALKAKKEGKDISHWYKPGWGQSIIVNIGYLKYVWERRRKIQLYCQDEYYPLVDKYSNSKLASMFSKYAGISQQNANVFFTNTLFANTYFTNLSKTNISHRLIQFHNFIDELKNELVFDNVDDEYSYYEAMKLKEQL